MLLFLTTPSVQSTIISMFLLIYVEKKGYTMLNSCSKGSNKGLYVVHPHMSYLQCEFCHISQE